MVVKILSGLITSKIVAYFLGASGMAVLGNLRNFYSSAETVSTLGFQNGIVKYASENKDDAEKLKQTISTLFFTMLAACLVFGLLLFVFADYFNAEIFAGYPYSFVFKFMAVALPWLVLHTLFLNLLNGFACYKPVILINIIGNIIGLILTVALVVFHGINGALIATVLLPALIFLVSVFYISKEVNLKNVIALSSFDVGILKKMSAFSLMAIVSGFAGPMVYLAIRNEIITKIGLDAAGFWAACERISFNYMLFVSTLLTVYFMPKLVEAKTSFETSNIFKSYFKSILPIFGMLLLLIFIFRNLIIQLLFTEAFLPVRSLLPWQLAGDFFKAASLILGYQFFAKKMTVAFIVSEIVSLSILYATSVFFLNFYGVEGVVIGYFVTYVIYFFGLKLYFKQFKS